MHQRTTISHRSKMRRQVSQAPRSPVTWIHFSAVIVLLDSAVVHGLLCRQCFSLVIWDECDRLARDNLCTTVGVNTSHLNLLHENPTLALGNLSEFRCYKYRARINRHDDKGLVTGYGRGCTFAAGDFCAGWKPAVAVKQCDVCGERDLCNGAWPGLVGKLSVVVGVGTVMAVAVTGRYH